MTQDADNKATNDTNHSKKTETAAAEVRTWPVLPLRGMVIFPHTMTPLEVARVRSLSAIDHVVDDKIVLVTQKDAGVEKPEADDLYTVGTLATVRQIATGGDDQMRIIVEGMQRVKVLSFDAKKDYDEVVGVELIEPAVDEEAVGSYLQTSLRLFSRYDELSGSGVKLDENLVQSMTPGQIADVLAAHIDLSVEKRQMLLETNDPRERLQQIAHILTEEIHLFELEQKIEARVRQKMERGQREYYLRERMQMIRSELGEGDAREADVEQLREQIEAASLPDEAKEKAERELNRLSKMPPFSQEGVVVRTYLEWLTSLPWDKRKEESISLQQAEAILEEDHYGLEKVKERMIEFLAVHQLNDKPKSPIVCLVGPPGVGKTSLGQSLARAMGRDFFRFSLGGVRDESEIRGHRRTYIGAMPGRIIQGMRRAGTKNPVILLDEIDKMSADFRGDPSAALLEALDPEQNKTFSDHYLEVPFDLSECVFVTTANTLQTISPALLDRMEVIRLGAYTVAEKVQIAKRHLIPQALKDHGLKPDQLTISDNAIYRIIEEYTRESGVRELERMIATVCRKAARAILSGKQQLTVNVRGISTHLGPPPFFTDPIEKTDRIGIAHGLAYTPVGGDIIVIETTIAPGKGELTLTGKLGEVMRESAQTSLSYIRSRAELLGIDSDFHRKKDIHLHVPEGAVPKEGPSAGVAMTVAFISALTGKSVRWDVGMTGEMTLRGRVLPVGGIKEKVLAGHRAGLKRILVPRDNEKDLEEIPLSVRQSMRIDCVEHFDEVLEIVLSEATDRVGALTDDILPSDPLSPPEGDSAGVWISQDAG